MPAKQGRGKKNPEVLPRVSTPERIPTPLGSSNRLLTFERILALELESWKAQEAGDLATAADLLQSAFNYADEAGFGDKAQYYSLLCMRLQRDIAKGVTKKEAPPAYDPAYDPEKKVHGLALSHGDQEDEPQKRYRGALSQETQAALARIREFERDGNEKKQSGCLDQALTLLLKTLQLTQQHNLPIEAQRVALSCIQTYEAMSERQKRPPVKLSTKFRDPRSRQELEQGSETPEFYILKARDLAKSMNLVGEVQRLTQKRIHLWEEDGELHDKVDNLPQADDSFAKAIAIVKEEGECVGLERLIMCRLNVIERWAEVESKQLVQDKANQRGVIGQVSTEEAMKSFSNILQRLEQALLLAEEIKSGEDLHRIARLTIRVWEQKSQKLNSGSAYPPYDDIILCIQSARSVANRAKLPEERQRLTLAMFKLWEERSYYEQRSSGHYTAGVQSLRTALSLAEEAGLEEERRRVLVSLIQRLEQSLELESLREACSLADQAKLPEDVRRISLRMIEKLKNYATICAGSESAKDFLKQAKEIAERIGETGAI